MSIGVDVPIHLYSKGRTFDEMEGIAELSDLGSETTLGDIRAEIKFRALQQEKHWLGMAVAPYVTIPTGDDSMFLGEGRFTFGGNLALEHDFKVLDVALNGGYQYRGESDIVLADVGNAVKIGAGISRDFDFGLGFSVEYWASILSSSDQDEFSSYPMEAMAILRYSFGKNMPRVLAGGGAGLTDGAGAPAFRGVVGVDYKYCKPKPTAGWMEISVVDQDGNPLAAELKVTGPLSFTRTADASGAWESKKLKPGTYTIEANMDNHSHGQHRGQGGSRQDHVGHAGLDREAHAAQRGRARQGH